jgi:NAD(P)H-hydrate repair Nnr-like enzyme with NAD(P)H-hydrate epimerase domain
VPLGVLLGARSGDKGGDANVGVWADEDDVAKWLQGGFTTEAFRALLPELDRFAVDRYPLPNLRAVNFVVHGILGWGVASNLRLDTQAKGLGELLRSRAIDVPSALVASGKPAQRLAARPDATTRPF